MANNNNVDNVAVGKPNGEGAIYIAPKGSPMPTSAAATLDAEFHCIGLVSEDGYKVGETREVASKKAWGGTTVRKTQNGYEKSVKLTAIETENEWAAKLRYGAANVKASNGKVTEIKHNADELDHWCMVVDLVTGENGITRHCYTDIQPTETDEISYKDEDLVGFGMTLTAYPGADGDFCKEYHAVVTAPSS